VNLEAPHYRPSFPAGYKPGVGIVGCGGIVKLAHLPAYTAYGVRVVGVYDHGAEAAHGIRERFPVVERVFESLEELLAAPEIEIVDIATPPALRLELIGRALEAASMCSHRSRSRSTLGRPAKSSRRPSDGVSP
jgi:Oxidoreductase family, NAD-binding Rossmann fold